jgi:hypothetical protein
MPTYRASSRLPVSCSARARGTVALALALLALAPASCAPPLQNGGVDVAAGAGDRLGILCRFRRGEDARKDLCDPGEQRVEPARARRIASAADTLRGPLAAGREGDLLLENTEIVVVIGAVGGGAAGGEAGASEGGGSIIDAAEIRSRRDELGHVIARLGPSRRAVYGAIASGAEQDGTAWVEASGHDAQEPRLKVTTRYTLGPLDRAVLISTSLENKSDAPVGLLDLGDAIAWGSTLPLAPGKAPGFEGDLKSMYIGGVGASVGYLLTPVKDADVISKTGGGWSDVVLERDVVLPAGGRVQYERVLAVAPRGDPVAIAAEFFFMQGGAPGGVAVKLVDARGAAVLPAPGSRVYVERASTSASAPESAPAPASVPATWWISPAAVPDDPSTLGGEVPPGRYTLRYEGGGRSSMQSPVIIIKPGAVSPVVLSVSDRSDAPAGSPAPN